MNQNMVALDNFLGDCWRAYLVNLQWLMRNVILGMVMSNLKLSLTLLFVGSQRKNGLPLVIDSLL